MAEVVDWSPVDESNNTAPPVGAPENMAPSAVNNTMRAMMGSVRRWYDTVATQLGAFLPLSGGTVTGHVAFTDGTNGISIGGISLTNLLGALYVHNPPGGGGGISIDGATAGYAFSDRGSGGVAPGWVWFADDGYAHLLRLDGSTDIITASLGQVWITGGLGISGNAGVGGGLTVGTLQSLTNVDADGSITAGGNITAAGSVSAALVSAGSLTASGNITAVGSVNAAFINSSGGIATTGISCSGLTASGDIGGNGITANSATITNISATNVNATQVTGAGVVASTNGFATRDVLGGVTYALYTSGSTSYHQFLNQSGNINRWEWNGATGDMQWRSFDAVHWVMRRSGGPPSDNMCFNAIGPVGGFGAYYNSSDRRFKEAIEDDTSGLDAVLRLRPVSFNRIGQEYREVGFIAQELHGVIPEAVRPIGIPLPDGSGCPDDDDPTLGITTEPIIAALCNAVKELSERIQTLEGDK